MPFDPKRAKALFQEAVEIGDRAARGRFLDRECRDDPDLRRPLDELLEDHDKFGLPPETQPASSTEASHAPDDEADATVSVGDGTGSFHSVGPPLVNTIIDGQYRIRESIGEGGMGSVYLAEQLKPIKRKVALKLIKARLDSRQILARFETERQALALMDHPNIARVLDAGTTASGRPFFVMELVKGVSLTEYCDQNRLALTERLDLFRQICSAVQHAHQKGIIHRDLKPTNILVESHDGKPVPKVIDFGLAKATSGMPLSEQSLYSAFGCVAGTPLYMAPEQANFNAIDIDTRADIYSLGVILYELVTGTTPIQRETFKRAALDEMLRNIREPVAAPRPGASEPR